MWIESITIEGGFLDGFNQTLSPGLNVLIGGRGTGKSSVIELIRFCLGAQSVSDIAGKEALEHALGVLGDGKVTIILRDGAERIRVSRIANEPADDLLFTLSRPLVFSQKEIEQIGARAQSRMRLVDGFLQGKSERVTRKDPLRARIKSATTEIRSLLAEVDEINERLISVPKLKTKLASFRKESAEQSAKSAELDRLRTKLEGLTSRANIANTRAVSIERASKQLTEWTENFLVQLNRLPSIEHWPSQEDEADVQSRLRARQKSANQLLQSAMDEYAFITAELESLREKANKEKHLIDANAREIRQKIEEQQRGASAIDRQIASVSQELSALTSLSEIREDRLSRIEKLNLQREAAIDEMQSYTHEVTAMRQRVGKKLSTALAPTIRVDVSPLSDFREYLSIVNGSLRGSGLRYRDLAERIVETFSPQEIAILAENRDTKTIASTLGVTEERALRLVDSIRSEAGIDLLTAEAGDDVTIELLDGAGYKSTDFVSMGQRCTAVLPIILQHDERIIVLDQPEDHLDNAFIVGTLVKAINARSLCAQTIIATHNPNIPVLGDADWVAQLESDGDRCFIQVAGGLEDAEIVNSITTIMEGGREAFKRRAAFYGESGTQDDA